MLAEDLDRCAADEIRDRLGGLSSADFRRLAMFARLFGRKARMDPEDLLNEAIVRSLSSRTCGRAVDVIAFMAGIMKSISTDSIRARIKERAELGGPRLHLVETPPEGLSATLAESPSVDDAILASRHYGAILDDVHASIADDEVLGLLVEGICDGLTGQKLQSLLDVDENGLAAARKKLARRLAGAFPSRPPL